MAHMTAHPALISLETRKTLPIMAEVALRAAVVFAKWDERRKTRRALARLEPSQLRDIGLNPQTAQHEAGKFFWMA